MKKNTILSYFLTFILSIFIVFSVLSLIFKFTILNKDFAISRVDNSDFISILYTDINSKIENYILQSGLEESVFSNIVSVKDLKKEIYNIIEALYSNTEYSINTYNVSETLKVRINEALIRDNITISDSNSIDKFIKTILDEYTSAIFPSYFILDAALNFLNFYKYVKIILGIILATILFIILLFVVCIKNKQFFNFLGISCVTASVLLILLNIGIKYKILIENIYIYSISFSFLIRDLITNILNYILISGIALFIIGYIFLLINIRKSTLDK